MPKDPAKNLFRSYAIVPAAGRSRRMGTCKLLLPWQGGTLIEHVVSVWRQSQIDEIVVVVSPDNEALRLACRALECHVVVPAVPPPEMKDSVCRGLEFIAERFMPTPEDAWLVAPADLPSLSAACINAVLAAHDPAAAQMIVPCDGSRRGHPALFPWSMAAAVRDLDETQSLKDILAGGPLREIQTSTAVSFDDVDTPLDYLRLQDRHNR